MLEQYKLAVVSTAHLTEAENDRLQTTATRTTGFIVAPFEEGYFVSCQRPGAPDSEWPSLEAVRAWAAANGFAYVMLDRDAEPVPELPVYEW